MLIFSSVGPHAAATGRVVDTLVGAAAGTRGRPRLRGQAAGAARPGRRSAAWRARSRDCSTGWRPTWPTDEQDGTALEGTALEHGHDLTGEAAQWLAQARALRDEIERVDDTLREAADSARLNPRALVTPGRRGAGHRDDRGAARRPRGT